MSRETRSRNPSGAVHPTIFLVAWFVVAFGLHRLWPVGFPGASQLEPMKYGLLLAGLLLFAASALALRRHGTPLEHGTATTALVTGGPYALSRNPIYLALVLILFGMALDAGSVWFLVTTVLFGWAVRRFTVLREEAYLERVFGEEYLRYRSSVRRWL